MTHASVLMYHYPKPIRVQSHSLESVKAILLCGGRGNQRGNTLALCTTGLSLLFCCVPSPAPHGPSHTWASTSPLHANNSTGGKDRRMPTGTFLRNPKGCLGLQNTLGGELPTTCFSARLSVSPSYLKLDIIEVTTPNVATRKAKIK